MKYRQQQKKLRRSGRTTRLLKRAASIARKGGNVIVVMDYPAQLRAAAMQCADMLKRPRGVLRVSTSGRSADIVIPKLQIPGIRFILPSENFDWRAMREPGYGMATTVLVDHHVIEDRFAGVLEMLHRFDH